MAMAEASRLRHLVAALHGGGTRPEDRAAANAELVRFAEFTNPREAAGTAPRDHDHGTTTPVLELGHDLTPPLLTSRTAIRCAAPHPGGNGA